MQVSIIKNQKMLIRDKMTNDKMTKWVLRYVLRELKWLSEVVIEQLYLLWSETALCGDVPRGGETCRELGVGTNPVI